MKKLILLPFAALVATLIACDGGPAAQQFALNDLWVKESIPGAAVTAAYVEIRNGADADRLVAANAPEVAGLVELHEMVMDGDVMRMRQVEAIDLPANSVVELKPGGLHIMLMELKRQVVEGETVEIELLFEKRAPMKVEALVRKGEAMGGHHGGGHGGH